MSLGREEKKAEALGALYVAMSAWMAARHHLIRIADNHYGDPVDQEKARKCMSTIEQSMDTIKRILKRGI